MKLNIIYIQRTIIVLTAHCRPSSLVYLVFACQLLRCRCSRRPLQKKCQSKKVLGMFNEHNLIQKSEKKTWRELKEEKDILEEK